MKKKLLLTFFISLAVIILGYGGIRTYYAWTDGFQLSNIERTVQFDEPWSLRQATRAEAALLDNLSKQTFTYLGKGCQSYVFESADGLYVLKFVKHQRFRTKPWLDMLAFIPYFDSYRNERLDHKKDKLSKLLVGWQTAYNQLPKETGVAFVHLNEQDPLPYNVKIVDKMGYSYTIPLQSTQFMVQRKVEMLCPYLERLIVNGQKTEAQIFLDRILSMISGFYMKGFADYDYAIMQNTGVYDGYPVPFDVGQLVRDDTASQEAHYKQALFNKTYRFKVWLGEKSPELREYLEKRLKLIIGPDYESMKPHFTV